MNEQNVQQRGRFYTYLPAVDCLRFLVFLLILANHTNINKAVNGHSFFFTLTGFLISYISISEIQKTNSFSFKRYLARRFLRTLPLYFLLIVSYFVISFLMQQITGTRFETGRLLPHLFLVQNFFPQNIFFPLATLWAICVTEQSYLFLGFLFLFFYKQLRWLGIVLTVAGLVLNCIMYFQFHFYTYTYSYQFVVNLGVGNMLAFFCINRGGLFNKLSQITFTQTVVFYFIAVALLCFGFFFRAPVFTPFKEIVLATGYSLLIFNLGFAKYKPKFFENAVWMQTLGKKAFGLFCWHAPIFTLVAKTFQYFNLPLNSFLLFIITLMLVIPVANISYRYFEVRFLKFKDLLQ
jgi:peptidoglycan/LPS O-acetylase OafA/YrhL